MVIENYDRLQFRVWNGKTKSYLKPIEVDELTVFLLCHFSSDYIVEQSTGLKDANHNDIYEGDVVYIPSEDVFGKVCWDRITARFTVIYEDICTDFDHLSGGDLEVFGNIHEFNFYIKDEAEEVTLDRLIGKTINCINGLHKGSEEIIFGCTDGTVYKMYHPQDCCEQVDLDDFYGDVQDIMNSPILKAEVRTNNDNPKETCDESCTWTFYTLSTIKGTVDLRWYGTSNGYYSERVDFIRIK